MSYSQFTLETLQKAFNLTLSERVEVFSDVPEVAPSNFLTETLQENIPLAIAVSTEKARSELIISPILVAIRKHFNYQISLFSGVDFNVDIAQGLSGVCDFLIGRSPEQLFIKAPVIALVEAKNDNIKSGLGQCAAEMVAAQLFNQKNGLDISAVYGCVTTGTVWQFLKLEGQVITIDLDEYYLRRDLNKILGILASGISSN